MDPVYKVVHFFSDKKVEIWLVQIYGIDKTDRKVSQSPGPRISIISFVPR